ncbi:hypothetical protein GGTG_07279 [Gaeumannomyces tritici R3-111a-1]|uniref:Uncharacterized protein n=1 Tax=Gaeumannomyces tritici (strain R3-111a-1) TaxID=644352 RepID=J3P182_GAET3|nr:hypothetical protein GGTG_07279 [Gaeumannomyces tritici R3-111a-1]EJT77367.1 hypothetical protein GGTG_07279 [Gaeumannomyces tritici R3-111a-1]
MATLTSRIGSATSTTLVGAGSCCRMTLKLLVGPSPPRGIKRGGARRMTSTSGARTGFWARGD